MPVRERVPFAYDAEIPVPAVAAASTSPGSSPEETATEADTSEELCASLTVSAGSTATGAPAGDVGDGVAAPPSASGAAGAVTISVWLEPTAPTDAVTVGVPGCVSSM